MHHFTLYVMQQISRKMVVFNDDHVIYITAKGIVVRLLNICSYLCVYLHLHYIASYDSIFHVLCVIFMYYLQKKQIVAAKHHQVTITESLSQNRLPMAERVGRGTPCLL